MKKVKLFCFVLVLICVVVYFKTLKFDFVYDDVDLILKNNFIKDIKNVSRLLSLEYFRKPFAVLSGARPLTVLSLMVDYRLFSERPYGYHLTNIVIHTINSILVFILLTRLFFKYGKVGLVVSFVGSLVFALHPLQGESVSVITFRNGMLACMFSLIGILFFDMISGESFKDYFYLFLGVLFLGFSFFSKEVSIGLVLVVLFMLFYKNRKIFFYGLGMATVLVLTFLSYWLKRVEYRYPTMIFFTIDVNPVSSLVSYFNTIFMSLKHNFVKLILPYGLSIEYYYRLPRNIFNFNFLFFIFLSFIIVYFFVKYKDYILRFGMCILLCAYLPVSNIVPLPTTVADRYMYLPIIGASIIFSWISLYLIKRWVSFKFYFLTSSILVAILMLISFNNLDRFKDMDSLYSAGMKVAYDNVRLKYNYGMVRFSKEDYFEVIKTFSDIEKFYINKTSPKMLAGVWEVLGDSYYSIGDYLNASKYYFKLVLLTCGEQVEFLYRLALAFYKMGKYINARKLLERVIKLKDDPVALNGLAVCYIKEGKYKLAKDMLNKAISLQPGYLEAWFNLMNLYEDLGNKNKVEELAEKLAEIYNHNGWGEEIKSYFELLKNY